MCSQQQKLPVESINVLQRRHYSVQIYMQPAAKLPIESMHVLQLPPDSVQIIGDRTPIHTKQ
jgi:hypothetical protein